jgi:hypothetical protein
MFTTLLQIAMPSPTSFDVAKEVVKAQKWWTLKDKSVA